MKTATAERLLELNRRFYRQISARFSATRQAPWPGWRRLFEQIELANSGELACLDLGCGNGRFGVFLAETLARAGSATLSFHGVDSNQELLSSAHDALNSLPNCRVFLQHANLADFSADSEFDLVVLWGVFHHIPGRDQRRQLLEQSARAVKPFGFLAFTLWHLEPDQLARLRLPWSGAPEIDEADLEPGDCLLSWDANPATPRYCHFPTADEIEELAPAKHFADFATFTADGRTGQDNLYRVFQRLPIR